MATITKADIRGALARAYCHEDNRDKQLDSKLLNAAAVEVTKLFDSCADANAVEMSDADQSLRARAYEIALKSPNSQWGDEHVQKVAAQIFDDLKFGFAKIKPLAAVGNPISVNFDIDVKDAKAALEGLQKQADAVSRTVEQLFDPTDYRREGWNDLKTVILGYVHKLDARTMLAVSGPRGDGAEILEGFTVRQLQQVRRFVASFKFSPSK